MLRQDLMSPQVYHLKGQQRASKVLSEPKKAKNIVLILGSLLLICLAYFNYQYQSL